MKHLKKLKFTLFGLLAVAAAVAGLQTSADATVQVALKSGLFDRHTAQPGETVQGQIVVEGVKDKPVEMQVYLQDYMKGPGTTSRPDPGTLERSLANWVTFSPSRFQVAKGETQVISYEIEVPQGEDISGSYWSAIMIQPANPAEFDPDVGERRVMVRNVMRYAISVVLNVGETGTADLEVGNVQVKPHSHVDTYQIVPPRISVSLLNNGTRYAVYNSYLEVYDSQGQRLGRYEGDRYGLLPSGGGRQLSFKLGEDLQPGDYQALLVLEGEGDTQDFGARFNFSVEDSPPELPPKEELKKKREKYMERFRDDGQQNPEGQQGEQAGQQNQQNQETGGEGEPGGQAVPASTSGSGSESGSADTDNSGNSDSSGESQDSNDDSGSESSENDDSSGDQDSEQDSEGEDTEEDSEDSESESQDREE